MYDSVRYEGFGPAGIAIIVEALTDNRNRTASEIRTAFNKHGGNLGESNSVSFMFQRKGVVTIPKNQISVDELLEIVLEIGADDLQSDEENHYVTTAIESFGKVRDELEKKIGNIKEAKLSWIANNPNSVAGETAESLMKLMDALEDSDDVQAIFINAEIDET